MFMETEAGGEVVLTKSLMLVLDAEKAWQDAPLL
jgi:hypothetical protein